MITELPYNGSELSKFTLKSYIMLRVVVPMSVDHAVTPTGWQVDGSRTQDDRFISPTATDAPTAQIGRTTDCMPLCSRGDETKHRAYVVGDDDRGCFHQSYCMSTRQGCRTRRTCRASDRRPP